MKVPLSARLGLAPLWPASERRSARVQSSWDARDKVEREESARSGQADTMVVLFVQRAGGSHAPTNCRAGAAQHLHRQDNDKEEEEEDEDENKCKEMARSECAACLLLLLEQNFSPPPFFSPFRRLESLCAPPPPPTSSNVARSLCTFKGAARQQTRRRRRATNRRTIHFLLAKSNLAKCHQIAHPSPPLFSSSSSTSFASCCNKRESETSERATSGRSNLHPKSEE